MSDADDASHALLLRLFQSEFFSPHLALSYLRTYSDSIGITYYLVEQLQTAFDQSDVEFYWAQLCHLLISKPSKSRALEYFVLQRCDESVHVALLTLWYFQAALFDLAGNPSTDSFQICQRIFNECQRLLYDDPLADTDLVATYSGASLSVGALKRRLRIRAKSKKGEKVLPSNSKSCFVGMGSVIASVPGMPSLAGFAGKMAIEQGRRKPQGRDRPPLEGSGMQRIAKEGEDEDEEDESGSEVSSEGLDDDTVDTTKQSNEAGGTATQDSNTSGQTANDGEFGEVTAQPQPKLVSAKQDPVASAPPSSILNNGKYGSSSTKSSTGPNGQSEGAKALQQLTLGFNQLRGKAATAVNDVFGQSFGVEFAGPSPNKVEGERPLWHAQRRKKEKARRTSHEIPASAIASTSNLHTRSSLNLSPHGSSTTIDEQTGLPSTDALLSRYDKEARRRLLRSNYCRRQTQFLQTLQDISARLLLIPKPARLSALRAELTELNHGLPAEVCFPLWCEAAARDGLETTDQLQSDSAHPKESRKGRHHRVLRINPSEAVVLNSADRVPFLLHVEVLKDDLDFDADRKQNLESLRKLVLQEDTRRRQTAMSRIASSPALSQGESAYGSGARSNDQDSAHDGHAAEKASILDVARPQEEARISSQGLHPFPSDASVRKMPSPKIQQEELPDENEEIDLTEQAFGSDLAAFGEEHAHSEEEEDLATINISHDKSAWSQAVAQDRQNKAVSALPRETDSARKNFSLDEYSERMRTAAVMLAQLNHSSNAAAQPIVASNPLVSAQGGWSSWIIGTGWAAVSQASKQSEAGQGNAGVRAPVTMSNGGASNGAVDASATNKSGGGGYGVKAKGKGSRFVNTDTDAIRKRIMQEMMALEEERMQRMKAIGARRPRRGVNTSVEDEATVQRAVNKDDPSAAMFRESWAAKKARIRSASPYGHLVNWDVFSVIVKTGADLRQEQLAVQLIREFARIWGDTGSRCWVRYFRILVTSENSGIMETVTDAISVHSIKKEAYSRQQAAAAQRQAEEVANGGPAQPQQKIATYSLLDHFVATYGDPSSAKFGKARQRFIESLAGYSILSYLLQIKDRHNGNILIDGEGHVIHIDFGFMLGISPGGVGFEAAPFKMPQEYIDLIGGVDSPKFVEFKSLVAQGFRDVRKHAERVIMMVELMQKDSKLPCFALGDLTASYLRDRFQLALSQTQCDEFVDRLISSSMNSTFTRLYDQYQYYSEGILS